MLRPLLLAGALASALAVATPGYSYPWPVRPFDRPHPVRGNFGDPQTIFTFAPSSNALAGPGRFSFRDGVDIAVKPGTDVFPVASGQVTRILGTRIVVAVDPRHAFEYGGVRPAVEVGSTVVAGATRLGRTDGGQLTLSEFGDGRPLDPLAPDHLTPYRDRTKPRVTDITFRDANGTELSPLAVFGRISIVADAFDLPTLAGRSRWRTFPVAPAALTWQLRRLDDDAVVVPPTTVVDFLVGLPPQDAFWTIYARGTYQNSPTLGTTRFSSMPGRYLYVVTPSLNTGALRRGVYVVTVTAVDARGNRGSLSARFTIVRGTVPI